MIVLENENSLDAFADKAVGKAFERFMANHAAFARGDKLAYSETEAAALLGVSPKTLGNERRAGHINARKVGKEYRYSITALLEFVNGNDSEQ